MTTRGTEIDYTALAKIGTTIVTHRKALGLTGHDLATRVEISQSHLSYIESGKRPAAAEVYAKIAAVLDLPASKITPKAAA